MSGNSNIVYEVRGAGAWVRLNRPDALNALSFGLMREFGEALARARADDAVRALIVIGTGRAFCAGADLKERRTMPVERVPDFVRNIRGLMDDVAAMPQPTIAVVNGVAFGGGTELLLACDLRVCAPHGIRIAPLHKT